MKSVLIVDDIKGWREYHKQYIMKLFNYDCEIIMAESAREGYDKLLENNNNPFDLILTDLQMEEDFEPKYAGEWLIEQIKTLTNYYKTQIVIVSATYNINVIAERFGVSYIRKSTARSLPEIYAETIKK